MSASLKSRDDLHRRLESVFQNVFDDDSITITESTAAKDIDGWDSLMNITLMVNVEKEFDIRLSAAEIGSLKNVGELLSVVEARANK